MRPISLHGRAIGPDNPCFIVAEAGVNHNGSLALARNLVDAAWRAGADAVKFQTFDAARLVTAEAPKAAYQRARGGDAESQLEMLKRLELTESDHVALVLHCRERGIEFLSTPFDEICADFLYRLDMPLFKMASGEITNVAFLAHVARLGRPMIVSTGMSYLAEVETAVSCIAANGNPPLALLQCVSNYPASPGDANLRAMHTMRAAFDVPVGFSDHTPGADVALAAVAVGACILEKHLTLDRELPGPDHEASLEPAEFAAMVRSVRSVEAALGTGRKEPVASEAAIAAVARKTLVAALDLEPGTSLTADLIATKRAGAGLLPAQLPTLIGRRVRRRIKAGDPLTLHDLE